MRRIVWAGLAAAITLIPIEACAAVSVIGGGLARACADAAFGGRSDQAAVDTCSFALDAEPMDISDRASTLVNRGVLRLRQAAFTLALADFDAATAMKADLGEAYVNRGAAYIGQARFGEAVTQIERGLALGVEAPEKAYYNRALAHEGLGDFKAAYYDYHKALELRPDWTAPATELTRFTVR